MRRLPLVLLLSACPPPYVGPRPPPRPCPGSCFLGLCGSDDCEGFGAAESRIRAAFPPRACDKLQHYHVHVVKTDGGSWYDPWGRQVAGLTWCHGAINVGTDRWRTSALAHEAVHALECPASNYNHLGWADAGWDARINTVDNGEQPAPFFAR